MSGIGVDGDGDVRLSPCTVCGGIEVVGGGGVEGEGTCVTAIATGCVYQYIHPMYSLMLTMMKGRILLLPQSWP